jgi:primase-polymerase (primpol)-like protein
MQALPVALEEWEAEAPEAYRGGGVGYVLVSADPWTGIDLDHCIDPDTGVMLPWAQTIVDAFSSYTELTPSRLGLHIWVTGVLPPIGRKHGLIELYDRARFLTVTGWHVPGTPRTIEGRQEALYEVHARVFGPQALTAADGTTRCYCPQCCYVCTLTASGRCPACSTPPLAPAACTPAPTSTPLPLLGDAELLRVAGAAGNGAGARFTALYGGDCSAYASWSEADMGLCLRLAFWTQDPDQIDRLFRQSKLMRGKWDTKHGAQTYGQMTISKAIALQEAQYTPPSADPDRPYYRPLPRLRTQLHGLPSRLRRL